MIYSLMAMPFADMKSNMVLVIEELGTLISVLLLIFIKLDLRRQMAGDIVVYTLGGIIILSMGLEVAFLITNISRKCCKRRNRVS